MLHKALANGKKVYYLRTYTSLLYNNNVRNRTIQTIEIERDGERKNADFMEP